MEVMEEEEGGHMGEIWRIVNEARCSQEGAAVVQAGNDLRLDQCRVLISILPVYLKDPDVALITAKTLSVQRCTLHALNARHLIYVAEEEVLSSDLFF